jgi:hypothetical protein
MLNYETKAGPCVFEIATSHCIKPAQRTNLVVRIDHGAMGAWLKAQNSKSHINIR